MMLEFINLPTQLEVTLQEHFLIYKMQSPAFGHSSEATMGGFSEDNNYPTYDCRINDAHVWKEVEKFPYVEISMIE